MVLDKYLLTCYELSARRSADLFNLLQKAREHFNVGVCVILGNAVHDDPEILLEFLNSSCHLQHWLQVLLALWTFLNLKKYRS